LRPLEMVLQAQVLLGQFGRDPHPGSKGARKAKQHTRKGATRVGRSSDSCPAISARSPFISSDDLRCGVLASAVFLISRKKRKKQKKGLGGR
jgi:hypothetical protein